ncbi:hypothetical protein FQA39_LY11098 [Lamprigera yunnana]|nr:hypothetical protein FQA39_LY11098 [Lamprigera yunnana]
MINFQARSSKKEVVTHIPTQETPVLLRSASTSTSTASYFLPIASASDTPTESTITSRSTLAASSSYPSGGDVMANVEASDNENYDDTLKIIPQQITAEKRVLQNNPSHKKFFEVDGNENIKTPIEPNVQDMYFNPRSNVASTSTSSVTVTPKRSFATVFKDVIPWPHHTLTVGKRKKEYTSSVITFERLDEYYELKEKEDLKAEKKKKEGTSKKQ